MSLKLTNRDLYEITFCFPKKGDVNSLFPLYSHQKNFAWVCIVILARSELLIAAHQKKSRMFKTMATKPPHFLKEN